MGCKAHRGAGEEASGQAEESGVAVDKRRAAFIEPMLLLRTDKLPEGPDWVHELKFEQTGPDDIERLG
jgi:ATP-dependent DNA ligase